MRQFLYGVQVLSFSFALTSFWLSTAPTGTSDFSLHYSPSFSLAYFTG